MQVLDVMSPLSQGQPGRGSSSSFSSSSKSLETAEDETEDDDEEERKGELLERVQVSEQVGDLFPLQPFQQTFRHDRRPRESRAFNVVARNAKVFAVRLTQHDRVFVLQHEQALLYLAVADLDAEATIAGFHRGVGSEDVSQQGFNTVRARAVEDRADLPALAMNTVTDTTCRVENLLTANQVARLVCQRVELSEFCFQRLRFNFGHQWRQIAGALDVRGAMQFPPGITDAVIK